MSSRAARRFSVDHRLQPSAVLRAAILLLFSSAVSMAGGAYDPGSAAAPIPANPFLESLTRRASAAAFLGDGATLLSLAAEAEAYEDANQAQLNGFRLSDNLRELAASLASARNVRLEGRQRAAKEADAGVRLRWQRDRLADPYLEARRIAGMERWNRIAGWFNRGAQSVAQLANGNASALAGWVLGIATSWRGLSHYDEWDRKQRALYEDFLRRYPDDPLADEVRRNLDRYERRQKKDVANRLKDQARLRLDARFFEDALFFGNKAGAAGADIDSIRLRAEQALSAARRDQARVNAIAGPGETGAAGAESTELNRLLALLAAGDSAGLEKAADQFTQERPDSEFADEALYLSAMAAGMNDHPEKQEEALDTLREAHGDSNMAWHARNLDRSAATSPKSARQAARAQLSSEKWGFAVFGDASPVERLDLARDGRFYSRGFQQYLSAMLVVDGIVRSIRLAFGGGPPNDAVRDASAQWLRAVPEGDRAPKLAKWLAGEAEDNGAYDLAAEYRALAGGDSAADLARLKKKRSRDLLTRIEQLPDPAQRKQILDSAASSMESPELAERARKEAQKAAAESRIRLSKGELAAMPELWRGRALNWQPAWFDGRTENGELDDRGVEFTSADCRDLEFTVVQESKRQPYRQHLDGAAYEQARAALEERHLVTVRQEAADSRDQSRGFPVDLEGSAGSAGLLVYPSLRPFTMSPEELRLYR